MTLDALGWSGQRQRDFAPRAADGLIPGRVVGEHRTHFRVATDAVELSAEITGRLRNAAAQRSDLAGVGDFVAVRLANGDGPATIEEVLPRTSALVRKASGEDRPQLLAANVDVVFIVTAPDGDLNLPRIERLLALVADSSATPVIVLNKADLTDDVVGTHGADRNDFAGRSYSCRERACPPPFWYRAAFRRQPDRRPHWLLWRREVDLDERPARPRRPSDAGSSRARQPRSPYDNASPAVLAPWRRLHHRYARHARRGASGIGTTKATQTSQTSRRWR